MGFNEYATAKKNGKKLSLGAAAELVGSTRLQVSRVRDLLALSDQTVIDVLFRGGKVNIGTRALPSSTDSLISLITYFKARVSDIVDQSDLNSTSEDFTDDEIAMLNAEISDLQLRFGKRLLEKLNSKLFFSIKGGF